jgi:hypothetical protein
MKVPVALVKYILSFFSLPSACSSSLPASVSPITRHQSTRKSQRTHAQNQQTQSKSEVTQSTEHVTEGRKRALRSVAEASARPEPCSSSLPAQGQRKAGALRSSTCLFIFSPGKNQHARIAQNQHAPLSCESTMKGKNRTESPKIAQNQHAHWI